jgi:hypothetical protein
MAGRPRTRAKLEALERFRNGDDPKPGDEEWLTPDNKIRTIQRNPDPADDANARGMYKFVEWVMGLTPDMQELLERLVEEPDNAPFSHQTVQRLAMTGASDRDIAVLLNVDRKEMTTQARAALDLGRTIYRFLLTHRQFGASMAGDRTLLVWLGRQKLGQMDRPWWEPDRGDGRGAPDTREARAADEKRETGAGTPAGRVALLAQAR